MEQSHGDLLDFDRVFRFVSLGGGTSYREAVSSFLVLAIACYMAFSAGASNVANAIAPLYDAEAVNMNLGIFIAVFAIGIGAFTIARKTLATVGDGITDLPLLAALVVSAVSASIITALSHGYPCVARYILHYVHNRPWMGKGFKNCESN